ncbi:imidazole glycerol phosphate synthase subunit HisH [Desulfitibacter alkalitolerans]|uniref:imidazole glycerol phosphate synthase subunit HisH n=1 Tax=Desulfitibacter alkalitolerans TaxID=264641 RepID=UPI00048250E2
MITIIDYGMGNLRSVQKSLEGVGYKAEITSDPEKVAAASGIILPGVGAFADAIENLKTSGMVDAIMHVVKEGKPLLGICLGMQLLMTVSEENGFYDGLGIIEGQVLKIPSIVKVPHMGWNSITIKRDHKLISGVKNNSYFYFVHSYYVKPDNEEYAAASTHYGIDYCSIIARDNVMGIQFHPEKSSSLGQKILRNFGEMI